jgi:hypothetical protein
MELKIKKETAKEIYDESPSGLRKILEETFGIDCFKKLDWKDFKTFDDLCRSTGTTEVDFNNKWTGEGFDPSTIAFERLKICTRAYNQDWKYNLYDTTQKKWAPIFDVLSSGLGFSYATYDCDYSSTFVGSRLAFKSEETATHAGENFTKLFEDFNNAQY